MWVEGKSGNPKGRPKKDDSFKAYCEKWSNKIKKIVKIDDKEHKINSKEYSVIVLFKMIQSDSTPDQIKLQAIKLMLEYTEGKPQPEVVSNINIENVQEDAKSHLDKMKNCLDKFTPEEREEYFKLSEKLNGTTE